jgi:hypothetical protein
MTEPEKKTPEPCGVIAIMTNSTGDVIATASNFDRSAPGGCNLWEGQKWRARDQVKYATVGAYCSTVVSNTLSYYLMTQIADELCSKKGGHKITYRAIGYSLEVSMEVERS